MEQQGYNVLLCLTGSVASVRAAVIYRSLLSCHNIDAVVIVRTPSAKILPFNPTLPESATVIENEMDWSTWNSAGDPVLHIGLRDWADALLVAPLSANTLAKLAGGLCDNLLTCIARAWPIGTKPFVVAPDMDTAMWTHPITAVHLRTLQRPEFGVTVVQPVEKTLAGGEVGMGDMASPLSIAVVVSDLLLHHHPPINPPYIFPATEELGVDPANSGLPSQLSTSIAHIGDGQSMDWPSPWTWSSPAPAQQAFSASFATPQTHPPLGRTIDQFPHLPMEQEGTEGRPLPMGPEGSGSGDSRIRHCRKLYCPNQRDLCPGRWPRGKVCHSIIFYSCYYSMSRTIT